jgi:D-galactarolactone isomerase
MCRNPCGVLCMTGSFAQIAVPNSAGTETPKLNAPAGACDCHHHIYDPQFPFTRPDVRMIANARVSDYQLLQRRLGISRNIVVTPTPFPASFADNLVTLDSLTAFGANARGVAIVYPGITDAELKTLADGGVRGIRFVLAFAEGSASVIPATTIDAIESLGKRVNALGWHVQFNVTSLPAPTTSTPAARCSPPLTRNWSMTPRPEPRSHAMCIQTIWGRRMSRPMRVEAWHNGSITRRMGACLPARTRERRRPRGST